MATIVDARSVGRPLEAPSDRLDMLGCGLGEVTASGRDDILVQ